MTRDRALRDRFLAAKEQILISGSLVDETIALHALRRRPAWLPAIRARIDAAFGDDGRVARRPRARSSGSRRAAGVVGFPRIRPGVPVDPDAFYRVLFEDHGTIVGPGHWFEQPPTRTSAWATAGRRSRELREGLDAIDAALDATATD